MPNYTRAEIKRQADEKAANDAAIAAAAAKHAESLKNHTVSRQKTLGLLIAGSVLAGSSRRTIQNGS